MQDFMAFSGSLEFFKSVQSKESYEQKPANSDSECLLHSLSLARSYLDSPVVAVVALALAVQSLHVEDLGAEPLEDDADVLDAQMPFLIHAQLIDEQEELFGGDGLVLHDGVFRLRLGGLVLGEAPPAPAVTFNVWKTRSGCLFSDLSLFLDAVKVGGHSHVAGHWFYRGFDDFQTLVWPVCDGFPG